MTPARMLPSDLALSANLDPARSAAAYTPDRRTAGVVHGRASHVVRRLDGRQQRGRERETHGRRRRAGRPDASLPRRRRQAAWPASASAALDARVHSAATSTQRDTHVGRFAFDGRARASTASSRLVSRLELLRPRPRRTARPPRPAPPRAPARDRTTSRFTDTPLSASFTSCAVAAAARAGSAASQSASGIGCAERSSASSPTGPRRPVPPRAPASRRTASVDGTGGFT